MICSDVLFLETLVLEGYFLSTNGGVGEALNIGWGAQRKPGTGDKGGVWFCVASCGLGLRQTSDWPAIHHRF